MGLPGSGKTTLAANLSHSLGANWFNADEIRTRFSDWDFSIEGRLRQARRMRDLCDLSNTDYAIADFVAPLVEQREIISPDYLIWVDTIKHSKYPDTDKLFVPPVNYNFRVTEQDARKWADLITKQILNETKTH